jgi:hypothetical protein
LASWFWMRPSVPVYWFRFTRPSKRCRQCFCDAGFRWTVLQVQRPSQNQLNESMAAPHHHGNVDSISALNKMSAAHQPARMVLRTTTLNGLESCCGLRSQSSEQALSLCVCVVSFSIDRIASVLLIDISISVVVIITY